METLSVALVRRADIKCSFIEKIRNLYHEAITKWKTTGSGLEHGDNTAYLGVFETPTGEEGGTALEESVRETPSFGHRPLCHTRS